jgi:hypothetical protein
MYFSYKNLQNDFSPGFLKSIQMTAMSWWTWGRERAPSETLPRITHRQEEVGWG